jgi:hypothetical protein
MAKTTKPNIKIHDTSTNEVIEREMTDAEFEQYQIDQQNDLARWAQINAE